MTAPRYHATVDGQQEVFSQEVQSLRRLWISVFLLGLEDAVIAYKQWSKAGGKAPQINWEALRWINSDTNYAGQFVWLCELFDLDPARARGSWRSQIRTLSKLSRG